MFLKQSTAATIVLGPFVDDVDGKTAETALTIAQADVRLSKNGGSFAQKNDTGSAGHMENGYYSCALNTTDTNTPGRLRVAVSKSGALPVWLNITILAANVYDSLIGGGDYLEVDGKQWNGTNVATPATAGHPVVTVKSGTGTGEINLSGGNLAGSVGSLASQAKADVNAEVDTAIADARLDHLMQNAVTGTDVADNSVIAKLASKSATADWDTFNNTTDSLEARQDDKAGYSLAASGLDAVTVGEVTPGAEPTSITGLIRMIYNRHFRRAELTDTTLKTYEKDAVGGTSGVLTAQTVSDDGTTQIQQQATYP